jgi:hypothetical protein
MLLSKFIHRTLYYNFSEMKGASKNLLSLQEAPLNASPATPVTIGDLPADDKNSQKS